MFHTLTAVPFVEPLEQQGLELECVVRRRVGDAHQLGKDEEHEEVILLPPGSGNRTTIGGDIELFEKRLQPGETTLLPEPWRPVSIAVTAAAIAVRRSRMNADPASSITRIARMTMATSIQSRK